MKLGLNGWRHLVLAALIGGSHLTMTHQAIAMPPSTAFQKKIMPLIGASDSVMVVSPKGTPVVRLNVNKALIPASTLKMLTSLAALKTLGQNYRFKTEFYLDSDKNLTIKGYGDPFLVSERIETISTNLAARFNTVHDIVLDDFYFRQPIRIPGRGTSIEPYDAPNGALCVNFNTVAFTMLDGRLISAEPQTPLLPTVLPKIRASGQSSGRITLAANSQEALNYTGDLFHYFLTKNGVKVLGSIRRGRINPDKDRLVWQYRSEDDLGANISKLLEHSNNFMANQILLVLGAKVHGSPATMQKGLAALNHFYRNELGIKSGAIVEASGISRKNQITANAMRIILEHFSPYRKLLRKSGRQYYKTGHLKGIRSRVGYIESKAGGYYIFIVLLNTHWKSAHKIMKVLEEELE